MHRIKLLVAVTALMLALAVPAYASSHHTCADQGMRALESGVCTPYINSVAPANGTAYEPDELWAIKDWRHFYDWNAGGWYWQQYSTGDWY
jgi:hypothetical protein